MVERLLNVLVDVPAVDCALDEGSGFASFTGEMRRFALNLRLGQCDQLFGKLCLEFL